MNGFLVINKEKDMTSRDVVNKLNHIFATKKIGHTGTLDPLATGVLVMCLGRYTKLVDLITGYDKTYIAKVKLGVQTDTLDITGNILEENNVFTTKDKVEEVLKSFLGKSNQEVPLYSAVKIDGKKLYEYARNNEKVVLPVREIEINYIKLLEFTEDAFTFEVSVSKGTYIRSLVSDICKKLGVIGTMQELTRTKQGNFNIENSYTLEDVKTNNYKMLDLEDCLDFEKINLTDEEYFKVKNGAKITFDLPDNKYFMVYENKIIAIYEFFAGLGKLYIMLKITNE